MNGFDIVVIVLVVLAAKRGFKNGLASEFYRLFRIAVAIFAGTSLYKIFSGTISSVLHIDSGYSDPVLFVAASILVWKLIARLRKWIEALLLTKVPRRIQAVGGAVAAALKTGVFIVAIITTVSLSTWMPGHDWITKESFMGRTVQSFLPET